MRRGALLAGLAALALAPPLLAPGPGAREAGRAPEAPRRVVSMNVCTDQLAMMLAAPGQLLSVSHLARDPRTSAMAAEARAHPVNHGRAEEIYLLRPDLVLAGTFTTRPTVEMLRRLGIPVVELAPARSLADVPGALRAMGRALGRAEAAEARARAFEADLAALRRDPADGPRAALYYANGHTSGDRSLAGEILAAAGFRNVAAEAGYPAGGAMPLEALAMAAPDAVITGEPYPGHSRAEAILDHPVVAALARAGAVADADWVCGTPHVLGAVADLGAARAALAGGS